MPTIEQRHGLGTIGEVLQEGEHRVVGPVQILEHEHGRVARSAMCSRNRRHAVNSSSRSAVEVASIPSSGEQPLAEPRALLTVGKHRVELGDVATSGASDSKMPAWALQDLAERPERDAFAVGQAPTLTPGDQVGLVVDVGTELGHDPALAEPGLADHGDELGGDRGERLVEDALQDRQVDLSTDERGCRGCG